MRLQIDAGQLEMEMKPTCLRSVIRDVVATMTPIATAAGVTLTVELPTAEEFERHGLCSNCICLCDEQKAAQ